MANDRLLGQHDLLKALNGHPTYVGTITSTGSDTTNANTATPFTLEAGGLYLLQANAALYFLPGSTAVTANNGIKLAADGDMFYLLLDKDTTTLRAISASGTTNLKVFRLK